MNLLSFLRFRLIASVFLVAGATTCGMKPAHAHTIDLGLNLMFNDVTDVDSGGLWEVVAKTTDQGLFGVSFQLANFASSGPFVPDGVVNGADLAGFSTNQFQLIEDPGVTQFLAFQDPTPKEGGTGDVGVFYGFGTLVNGAPNYPDMPGGTMSIGPSYNSLMTVTNIPWATGDVLGDTAWDKAAILYSGTFAEGTLPSFSSTGGFEPNGQVFTSTGNATTAGDLASASITTTVRNDLDLFPDYNDDGVVDAADYTLWRDTLSSVVPMGSGADGDANGIIDEGDYLRWRSHFGESAPAFSPGMAIPSPSSGVLGFLGAVFFGWFSRTFRWISRRHATFFGKTAITSRNCLTPPISTNIIRPANAFGVARCGS